MYYPVAEEGGRRGFSVPRPVIMGAVTAVCVALACGVPVRQAIQAREQAHAELVQLLSAGKPDAATILAAFDRSNEYLTASITAPCLVLSMTILLLINQLLKLKRRYNEIQRDLERLAEHAHGA